MKKNKIINAISIGIFILSILVVIYASCQIIYSRMEVAKNIKAVDNIEKADKVNNYSKGISEHNNQDVNFDNNINDSNLIGKLVVERTKKVIPLVEGTDDDSLKSGAGHYKDSCLPGEKGNSIIFGHRDGVFSSLADIQINDIITVETRKGRFIYKIINTEVTEPKEEEILKKYDEAMLTLVTCYPFGYIGSAPQRFIVIAQLQGK